MNLIDGLNSELTRAKELLKLYEGIPTSAFGAAMIRQAIKDAEMSIALGESVEVEFYINRKTGMPCYITNGQPLEFEIIEDE